jgi:hypothetical protein
MTAQGAVELIEQLEEAEESFGGEWTRFMKYSPDEDVKQPEWDRLVKILNKSYRAFGRQALGAQELEGASKREGELWAPIWAEAQTLAQGGANQAEFWDHVRAFRHLVTQGVELVPEVVTAQADDAIPF